MSNLDKLTFDGECFLWDGDQVAFVEEPGVVCLSLSEEDFENGELDEDKIVEIRAAKADIISKIKSMGFVVTGEDDGN